MATRSRTRLGTDARRQQLLRIGAKMFATRPYDEVWIEEVAQEAGVSRGLLYHYFPGKKAFFAAVVQAGVDRLTELTKPPPDLPPLDRLRAGLDAYLDYATEYELSYRAVFRGALTGDQEIREILDRDHRISKLIINEVTGGEPPTEALRLAIYGWGEFFLSVCIDWLDRRQLDRTQLRELCVRTFIGAVSAAVEVDPTTPLAPEVRGLLST